MRKNASKIMNQSKCSHLKYLVRVEASDRPDKSKSNYLTDTIAAR